MSAPSQVLTSPAALDGVAAAWRELAAGLAGTSYFTSPDWVLSWWETLGRGLPGEVALWHGQDGRLEAVVGLARAPQRLHPRLPLALTAWTNLGSGPGAADHCGWPVLPGREAAVRAWLAAKARQAPLLLANLDPGTGTPLVPRPARLVEVTACPRLPIPPGGELAGLSSKFRKQLRYYERKLASAGVTFRWVGPEAMREPLIDVLLDLHERRWSLLGGRSSFHRGRAEFHRRLIARAGPGHGPALVLAERDGQAVGVLYGFLWRDTFAYYQTGWEPELASASLGTVLVAVAIRLAGAAGCRVFDFLRGAEQYKYRFGATDRCDETWLVPSGAAGWLLDLKLKARARLRRTPPAAGGAPGQGQGAAGAPP